MADKKIYFSDGGSFQQNEKVTIVDDINKADMIIDEDNIVDKSYKSNKKYQVVKNPHLASKKVYVRKNGKKGSGGLIILGIIIFFISPALVFLAMPVYGKILSIIYLFSVCFIFFEPKIIKKKRNASLNYYSGIKVYQRISYFLIGTTYLFFCRNCFAQFINFRKFDYINANFIFTIKWLYICSSITIAILLATRILVCKISTKASFKETIDREKLFIIIASCFLALTIIFGMLGVNKNESSSKKGALLNINELSYVETNEDNVILEYSFHNNTKASIYNLKNIHVRVTNEAGATVAEKTFESVSTGWWDKYEDCTVRLSFNFPDEADSTYFKSSTQVSLTTEISNYYLD